MFCGHTIKYYGKLIEPNSQLAWFFFFFVCGIDEQMLYVTRQAEKSSRSCTLCSILSWNGVSLKKTYEYFDLYYEMTMKKP